LYRCLTSTGGVRGGLRWYASIADNCCDLCQWAAQSLDCEGASIGMAWPSASVTARAPGVCSVRGQTSTHHSTVIASRHEGLALLCRCYQPHPWGKLGNSRRLSRPPCGLAQVIHTSHALAGRRAAPRHTAPLPVPPGQGRQRRVRVGRRGVTAQERCGGAAYGHARLAERAQGYDWARRCTVRH